MCYVTLTLYNLKWLFNVVQQTDNSRNSGVNHVHFELCRSCWPHLTSFQVDVNIM